MKNPEICGLKKPRTRKLFSEARRYLVGGVDSPVRAFNYVGCEPVLIKSGLGPKVYDYDDNSYIDYVMSWGACPLGHAHPEVLGKIKKALKSGLGFGSTNESEITLAKAIRGAVPFVEKIRFVTSGTEAVMAAIRLARGYTARSKIVKFENSYHGHADYLLMKSGSGLATFNISTSAGVPKSLIQDTSIAPYGDVEFIEGLFKKRGKDIAAVIIEPVGGNSGVIPPHIYFLNKLRAVTKKYGALLIFDEVITGFRFRYGAIAEELKITPDLICLGKIIGGGLPIGAYAGSEKIMNNLAPLGRVYQASTFSGNPIVMCAGLAALRTLKRLKNRYADIAELAKYLALNIEKEAMLNGIILKVSHYGGMFSIRFEKVSQFKKFYKNMLDEGIYLAPSEYEANFISFAHTKRDIDRTIKSAGKALRVLR